MPKTAVQYRYENYIWIKEFKKSLSPSLSLSVSVCLSLSLSLCLSLSLSLSLSSLSSFSDSFSLSLSLSVCLCVYVCVSLSFLQRTYWQWFSLMLFFRRQGEFYIYRKAHYRYQSRFRENTEG